GPRDQEGVPNLLTGTIRGIRSGFPIVENINAGPIAASLLNGFGNKVFGSVVFGDRFNQVGTPLDERVRKLFDGLQHQLQFVFAVVTRFVFAAPMTGDRIVGLLLDLGTTPLRLDIIAERVILFVAQLPRGVFDAETAHPLADIAAGSVATAVILTQREGWE